MLAQAYPPAQQPLSRSTARPSKWWLERPGGGAGATAGAAACSAGAGAAGAAASGAACGADFACCGAFLPGRSRSPSSPRGRLAFLPVLS